jgi:hypothetical protein
MRHSLRYRRIFCTARGGWPAIQTASVRAVAADLAGDLGADLLRITASDDFVQPSQVIEYFRIAVVP